MASTNCLAAVIKRENVERAQGRERIIVKTNVRFFFLSPGQCKYIGTRMEGKPIDPSIDRSFIENIGQALSLRPALVSEILGKHRLHK